jgi:hypothetical protein
MCGSKVLSRVAMNVRMPLGHKEQRKGGREGGGREGGMKSERGVMIVVIVYLLL